MEPGICADPCVSGTKRKKRNTACAKPYGNGRSDGSGHESGRFLYETAEYIFYGLDVL